MLDFKEKVNLFIYERKTDILRVMSWVLGLVSLFTLGSLVYYYGFYQTAQNKEVILSINKYFFVVFIFNFLLKLFFTKDRFQYAKTNFVELLLLVLVVVNYLSLVLFHFPVIAKTFEYFDVEDFEPYYVVIIQIYLLVLVSIEFFKSAGNLGNLRLKPTTIFIFSFVLLIGSGAGLLMLPGLRLPNTEFSFVDALFTSASASCVTGLIVVDTATFFNTKGKFILLLLFQLGGLGIVSFATFFATFMKNGIGLRHQSMMKDLFDSESLLGTAAMFRKVVTYTLGIELLSIGLLYIFWGNYPFQSTGERLFYSIFHGVSAFCNAGFSLFENGLRNERVVGNYLLHLVIAATIVMGGLGFPAIRDIFEIENVRDRLNRPWKQWKLSTKAAVYSSLVLIVLGALFFYLLEQNKVLKGMQFIPAVITSIFQSVTCRTAGFDTVDFGLLSIPTLLILMFLMFIGASSGSTGGGIKTSTFIVAFSAIFATITGKKSVTLWRRTISQDLIYKAFSVFIFSATFIFIATFLLTLSDPNIPFINLLFEEISAFATVGVSTGITSKMSDIGKLILTASMFVGRVGVLSLAFSLSVPVSSNAYKYPNSHIMIG